MKTTADIAESLLSAAKKLAAEEQTTIRALIEEGLRRILKKRQEYERFRLRNASFSGETLAASLR